MKRQLHNLQPAEVEAYWNRLLVEADWLYFACGHALELVFAPQGNSSFRAIKLVAPSAVRSSCWEMTDDVTSQYDPNRLSSVLGMLLSNWIRPHRGFQVSASTDGFDLRVIGGDSLFFPHSCSFPHVEYSWCVDFIDPDCGDSFLSFFAFGGEVFASSDFIGCFHE